MRRTCIASMLLLLSSGSLADTPDPLCVLSRDAMPETWLPSGEEEEALTSDEPWSESEAQDAENSIKAGLDEMIGLFKRRPSAVPALWEDSVGALIEVTYSSANKPEIDSAALAQAERNLTALIDPYLDREPASAKCDEFDLLLPLAIYAHKFYPEHDPRTGRIVALTNAVYRACGSLEAAMDMNYPEILEDLDAATDDVFDLVIWSLLFIEAELFPDIELPPESREFSPALWAYIQEYPLPGPEEFEEGVWDEEFVEIAYLATHIAYVPTGNHRFPIYIEDAPDLYRFHRETFYPVLVMGELDLVAEYVDSLRQYGCTASTDLQVRDGTRYLLTVFHDGGDQWMTYREPGQTDQEVDDYDLIHKAWTAVLGVRVRNIEPAEPGTYGGVVRRWLPNPR